MSEENPQRAISGFRPTNEMTLGHFAGAIRPAKEIQQDPNVELYLFVADIHGVTDRDPREVAPNRQEVVKECMALGIDPSRTVIYMQSDIETAIVPIANRISTHTSVGELVRIPNLKDRARPALRSGENDEQISLALLSYPVLMAADIFAQQAEVVAAGEDQKPNVELARRIARRFNKYFGDDILVEPHLLAIEGIRILSLDGKTKMSPENPEQAILLSDDPDRAREKIQKSVTAEAGTWSESIQSHFTIARTLTSDEAVKEELKKLEIAHMTGRSAMLAFKNLWGDITEQFLVDLHNRKAAINDSDVQAALRYNADKAEINAEDMLARIKEAMGF